MKEQNVKLNEQNNKLTEIKNIAKTIADHQVRIKKLEQQNATLSKNVADIASKTDIIANNLKECQRGILSSVSPPSSEVIISGLPSQLPLERHVIAEKVLSALDAQYLINDILDVRQVNHKVKSNYISQHVVGLKRRKGPLSSQHLFDSALKNIIRINEFLTNEVHSLYQKVKQQVRLSKWKYVWIRDGKIFVRKDDNSEKIIIVCEGDLACITPST